MVQNENFTDGLTLLWTSRVVLNETLCSKFEVHTLQLLLLFQQEMYSFSIVSLCSKIWFSPEAQWHWLIWVSARIGSLKGKIFPVMNFFHSQILNPRPWCSKQSYKRDMRHNLRFQKWGQSWSHPREPKAVQRQIEHWREDYIVFAQWRNEAISPYPHTHHIVFHIISIPTNITLPDLAHPHSNSLFKLHISYY